METVGFAARNEDVRQALGAMQAQSANPERLLPLGWTLWRESLREVAPTPGTPRAVLCSDGERWGLVMGTGDRYGTSASLKTLEADALRRTLQMAFGRIPDDVLCLCAGPKAEELVKGTTSALTAWSSAVRAFDAPESFVARALAREALEDPAGTLQLRQPPLEHPRAVTSLGPRLRRAAAVALACALPLLGGSVVQRTAIRRHELELARLLEDRLGAVAGYRVATKGGRAVEEAIAALDERLDPWTGRLLAPGLSHGLAKVLAAARQAGASVTHLALDDKGLTLSGKAPSGAAVDTFAALLRTAGLPTRTEMDARSSGPDWTVFLMTPEARR